MSRWFDFLIGTGVAAAKPASLPDVERPTDRSFSEQIREVLRLELEIAAECALKQGNLTAATLLRQLADTTHNVDIAALHAYARLLDDLGRAERSSRELRRVGVGWFPESAADYVARLVSRVGADTGEVTPRPRSAAAIKARSAAR